MTEYKYTDFFTKEMDESLDKLGFSATDRFIWTIPKATYKIEFIRPLTCVPNGHYAPRDFKFILPYCKNIAVGLCFETWTKGYTWGIELAHAHTEIDTICVKSGTYIFDTGDGQNPAPSDLMLHEYAHILAGEEAQHGDAWKREATRLGVKNPGPQASIEFLKVPLFPWDTIKRVINENMPPLWGGKTTNRGVLLPGST